MAQVPPSSVKGIGFDATCSLTVTDANGEPVIVTRGDQLGQYGERNVVLWADHRAEEEAELINDTSSEILDLRWNVLRFFGSRNAWTLLFFRDANFSIYLLSDIGRHALFHANSPTFRTKSGAQTFFKRLDLGEFVERGYEPMGAVGGKVLTAGMPVVCPLLVHIFYNQGSATRDGWGPLLQDGRLSDTPAIDESQYRS
ncbi:hypothetical protein F5887DRAFT_1082160 [Amanita rubescens]|nr:hypothetical protein F5887DRAFT_1082160 [Amanita rubescens]